MIHLFKDYYIDADKNCFILKEKTVLTKRDTKEKYDSFTPVGYYSSLWRLYEGFIRAVERDAIMDEKVKALSDFIETMDEALSVIKNTVSAFEDLKRVCVADEDEDDG